MVSCQRNQDPATNTLSEMCERLFPQHAHSFQFQLLTDSVDIDRFTLESDNGKILIKGNNRNSLRTKPLFEVLLSGRMLRYFTFKV